jgi:multidrug efflux pump subunit AcrB
MHAEESTKSSRGPIAWMAKNGVTANLLMLTLLVGGFLMASQIKQEVFPDFDLDMVNVVVPYPGASPEEVEQGIVLAVEEAVRGLEGVDEVTSTASEGTARITIEVLEGSDPQLVYQDVQQEVDRISTFPVDAEDPEVSLAVRRREVLQLQLYGDTTEWALRAAAEEVRDRLLLEPGVTQIDLSGARDYEIHVEVPQETLRRFGLTLSDIAAKISATSIEIPAGNIDTAGGELLLRLRERKDWAQEFAEIPIVTSAGGAVVTLDDIATVRDGFTDTDNSATYDGLPAVGLAVYRVGEQTPIGVSAAVHAAIGGIEQDLPPGIDLAVSNDMSEVYSARLNLLLRNGAIGLVLVLVLLGLFLEFRLACWVVLGIPVSFLGAFLVLPALGVSINMISMFAFIIALGIVVDDAIVAGENIFEYRQRGMSALQASIKGAQDVAVPITFSILTNVVAFSPLLLVPGMMGKIFKVIPVVVGTVFIISWVESLLILPAHLSHAGRPSRFALFRMLGRGQQWFSRAFATTVQRVYGPFLDFCIRFRYVTISIGLAVLVLTLGYATSGRMGFVLMPKAESDSAAVTAVLPYGSPTTDTSRVRTLLREAAERVGERNGGDRLVEGIFARVENNQIDIEVFLTEADIRPITTGRFTELWRKEAGSIPGLESILFESDRGGPGRGTSVSVQLSHRDIEVLDEASAELAEALGRYGNVKDINDGYTPGKPQLDYSLKTEGRSLGLTSSAVARQVRDAFYGAEALRQQRGRSEVKVMARLPESERSSEHAIENLMIRTPAGTYVPLRQIAEAERNRAYTTIVRSDGRRTVTVTANVTPDSETSRIITSLTTDYLPMLVRNHPGLSFSFEGRQADMRESISGLAVGFLGALLGIYGLLAIPFKSYFQPLIVMMAIPFGIVGAIFGHILMGYSMSVMSVMGVVALAGVVVNDSLMMIDYGNRRRKEGRTAHQAIHDSGVRRFRPIMLTTLTTFGGLAPMIFETSRQARFLIPMTLSLGYGLLFATAITLVLVPCLYMVLEDALVLFRVIRQERRETEMAVAGVKA